MRAQPALRELVCETTKVFIPHDKFISAQFRRVSSGIVLGSIVAAVTRLFVRDSVFIPTIQLKLRSLGIAHAFDGFHAYAPEMYVALIGLVALAVIPLVTYTRRFLRAWWAGITSLTTLVSAALVAAIILLSLQHLRISTVIVLVVLAAVVGGEYLCWIRPAQPLADLQLNIPNQPSELRGSNQWSVEDTDDPIDTWEKDTIGRVAVVELLAEHSLRNRTPIVALCADFGDGKTSVMNLFRLAIQDKAIVVSFSAWLPGSEATLASDLFRDIATECRKFVHVPQLRKQGAAYARTLSGSFSYLGGLREILPAQSQREEIDDLRAALARIPRPIVVLLDDIDRMQSEEILVLLKILRGAASIPNVTFICSFSQKEIKTELKKIRDPSDDYLEKFFPVTINLVSPTSDELGALFRDRLTNALRADDWFPNQASEKKFSELLQRVWTESLSRICTNLRRIKLLLTDILTAARPIKGEVNPFDLTVIETVRRFYPEVYRTIRLNPFFFTLASNSLAKGRLFAEEEKKRESPQFFEKLDETMAKSSDPTAIDAMLRWIFPDYAAAKTKSISIHQIARPTDREIAETEKRICDSDYFSIYFRAAVPQEMFSNAELNRLLHDLVATKTESEVEAIFGRTLEAIPKLHPKREDFLWKLGRALGDVDERIAEQLAYAAAARAADYGYDMMNLGEAARALNIVFIAAQKLSGSSVAQRILENAMSRATDDTFAKRLFEFTQDRDRNRVLTEFSHIDTDKVKEAFIERMRRRYGPSVDASQVDISKGDWWAFRLWTDNSAGDAQIEQEFWRRFIGTSRKRLAQMVNFIYPGGNAIWPQDPRPIIDKLFPTAQIAQLLKDLPVEELDDVEAKGIERFESLLKGRYPREPGDFI